MGTASSKKTSPRGDRRRLEPPQSNKLSPHGGFSTAFDWQNAGPPLPFAHPVSGRAAHALARDLHMLFALRLLAAFVVGVVLATSASAARIGILSNALSAQTAADYAAKIPGHTFTGVDVSSTVPALDILLANYDVLLLFEDTLFVNSTAVGNRVAEFANAGRAVVLGTFYDQDRSDATGGSTTPHGWGALETIDPNTTDGVGTAYAVRTLAPSGIASHALTQGVTSLAALRGAPGPYAGGNQAKPGSTVVATWSQQNARRQPDPAIAYRITGAACVIHIGIAPHYGIVANFNTYGVDFGGDFYRMWTNAFNFGAVRCGAGVVPGDFGQIAKGWQNRAELDVWRTAFPFAITLDGASLQNGFGPALMLHTRPDGRITT
jgi:hypothetical protein